MKKIKYFPKEFSLSRSKTTGFCLKEKERFPWTSTVIPPKFMIIRSFVLVFVALSASLAFGSTVISPQEAPLFPTRENFFTIPFEIKVDDSSGLPAEVELTYSTDQGMSWFSYGRVRPENKHFLFKSPADGEYWFIFKTYGQDGLVKETRRRGPMLRVLVDTIPPKLTLTAEQKSTGEILIQWSVEDANLARKTPQLQVSYSIPDQRNHHLSNWEPIAVDPLKVQSEGNKNQGELVIWPERNAVAFEIQAEIIDMAGNREMQSRTVSLTAVDKEEDSNALVESMQSAFKQSGKLPLKSVSEAASFTVPEPMVAKPLTPPRPPVQSGVVRPLPPPKPMNSQIAGLSEINQSLKSFNSAQSAHTAALDFNRMTFGPKSAEPETELPLAETSGHDFVVVGPLLFLEDATEGGSFAVGTPQTPIFTDSNINKETFRFSLENEPEMEDEMDDGPKFFIPNPKYAPPDLHFDDSLPASYDESEEEEETTEMAPEIREELTPPAMTALETAENLNAFIRITKISHLRGLKLSQILVKWETDESCWTGSEDARIHIFRGPSQEGPWTPIAVDQKNTGSYTWTVSQDDRLPFYLLLQCEGEITENRMELVSDLTMQPIQLPMALFK